MKQSFWERFANVYDLAMKKNERMDREAAAYIAEFLDKDMNLLEAACGTGRFSCALAKQVRHISCCDYAEQMVQQTAKKAQSLGLTNVDVSRQDIAALSFPDHSFDAALAANVLHLLPEPERAIGELSRVVLPGGLLIFPNFVNGENKLLGRCFLRFIELLGFQPNQEWNSDTYLQFLEQQGLEIIEHRNFSGHQTLCVAITRSLAG